MQGNYLRVLKVEKSAVPSQYQVVLWSGGFGMDWPQCLCHFELMPLSKCEFQGKQLERLCVALSAQPERTSPSPLAVGASFPDVLDLDLRPLRDSVSRLVSFPPQCERWLCLFSVEVYGFLVRSPLCVRASWCRVGFLAQACLVGGFPPIHICLHWLQFLTFYVII